MKESVSVQVEFDEGILTPEGDEVVCPVYTVPLNEFRLREYCKEHEITCYLPLKKTWKVHNVTSKGKSYGYSHEVMRPMFPSYVFVKMDAQKKAKLWSSHTIVAFLVPSTQESFLEDIRIVRACELAGMEHELEFNAEIRVKDRFVIQSGVWEGITGWLEKKENRFRWTVQLEFQHQTISSIINQAEYKMTRLEE